MTKMKAALAVAAATLALSAQGLAFAGPAAAAGRDGVCDTGEFCYYYNSDQAGSISDFTESLDDYGATQPDCYEFKSVGNGQGLCVKNHAASVWNRGSQTVRVYFNSNYGGMYQDFPAGAKANLDAALKNQNASHQFISSPPPGGCSTTGTGDTRTCAQAVTWANSHIGSRALGTRTCDHVVGLAYGWPKSGSTTAYVHWTQVPASYKHAGAHTVPAGGLAFFKGDSGSAGHVMISLGGGSFASTDVGTNGRFEPGRYGKTTIEKIESSFHQTYLGWTQPWFNINH